MTVEDIQEARKRAQADMHPLRPRPWSEIYVNTSCDYIIKGLIERGQHILAYGPSNTGKSFVTTDLAFRLAADITRWFGMKANKCNVLIITSEGGERSFGKRAAAVIQEHDISPDALCLQVITKAPNFGTSEEDAKTIVQFAQEAFPDGVDLIINDTLAKSMHGQSEDRAEGMGVYLTNVRTVINALDCAFVSVHHTGKDETRGARGSYAATADADAILQFETCDDSDRNNVLAAFNIEKMRDGACGLRFGYRLREVEVAVDDEGEPITTMVVDELDEAPAKNNGQRDLTVNQRAALDCLFEAIFELGQECPDPEHVPAWGKVITQEQWKARMIERSAIPQDHSNQRQAFRDRMMPLKNKGLIGVWKEWVWLTNREA